jgi:hypothetical protein
MVVSGNKLDDLEFRARFSIFDEISRRSAFATALDCTPDDGGAVVVCTKKQAKRIALEVAPCLIVVSCESLQVNELLPLQAAEQP